MRVLVACETSGEVREAFRALGHDAWSCDVLPADDGSPYHIQDDVLNHLDDGWNLMVGFPPCTYLTNSRNAYLYDPADKHLPVEERRLAPGLAEKRQGAIDFFMALVNAPIPHIAIENPVGIMSTLFRKPDQIIQPYQFGTPESKQTCLWLKNLPLLQPTDILEKPAKGYWDNQTPSGQNKIGPCADRWKIRSKTYHNIAVAIATQWSNIEGTRESITNSPTKKSRLSSTGSGWRKTHR